MTRASTNPLAIGVAALLGVTFGASTEALPSHRYLPASACSPSDNGLSLDGTVHSSFSGDGYPSRAYCPFVQEGVVTQTGDVWTFYDNQVKNINVQVFNPRGEEIDVWACTVTSDGGNCGNVIGSTTVGTSWLNLSGANITPWTQDTNAQLLPYVQIDFGSSASSSLLGVAYTSY